MTSNSDSPMIVGFVANLFFQVKIEEVARRLNYRVKWIERVEEISPLDQEMPEIQYAEHLVGPGATLLDNLTLWRPALILFDLSNDAIPWEKWISLITSVPATRRIPVLCFGSHMDVERLNTAREAGARVVLARSRFVAEMADLINETARVPDHASLEDSCEHPLSQEAIHGLEEFNLGEYFEAHEHLENAWMADKSVGRDVYRAVLQVAVAYYQIQRGNYKGAMKMFLRMRQWIDPLPDICRGINISQLRAEVQAVHKALVRLGPERIRDFDLSLLRPVRYVLLENVNQTTEK